MIISDQQKKFHNFSMRRQTSAILVCDDPTCEIEIKGSKISEADFEHTVIEGRVFHENKNLIVYYKHSLFSDETLPLNRFL